MPPPPPWSVDKLRQIIADTWGFRELRPLQHEAMAAILDRRDSLVVLPTGGGKSLCYQAPAVYRGGTTLVISPLIALMKDQVDSLRAVGVPAAQFDSTLSPEARFVFQNDLRSGNIRLAFLTPERLVATDFYRLLDGIDVHAIAIDEAHCISHWGHDFRPEYRQLARLRELFPQAGVHAYTATATEKVRQDIAKQLNLRNPAVIVGNFDRPNLTYRILPRRDELRQVLEVIERHPGEGGIVYCLRRKDVEQLAAALQEKGVSAFPYHAGLPADVRKLAQDKFVNEECDVIVATIAFGMGIDRSNVRYVLHVHLPKSLEHYQQETGRAGRDGLEAECVLFHSGGDVISLRRLIERSAAESDVPVSPEFLASARRHLDEMDRYCRGARCRHRALVEYFGQKYEAASCQACDICLGDTEPVPDSQVIAQKILSCVARVKESFGINQVVSVLRGEQTDDVLRRGHDKLSTYGLLKSESKDDVRDWIQQLLGHGVLDRQGDEYPVLKLNPASWEVMRGERSVRLVRMARQEKGPRKGKVDLRSWEGVDTLLFEKLRALRRKLSVERSVPPYVIFSDAVLRNLARERPLTEIQMSALSGVGDVKLRDFGPHFLPLIVQHVKEHPEPVLAAPPLEEIARNSKQAVYFDLFEQRLPLKEICRRTALTQGTIVKHLCEYIEAARPESIREWVSDATYAKIIDVLPQTGDEKLKPIFDALGERVPYDAIKLVLTHRRSKAQGRQSLGPSEPISDSP
ncbi:MAG TPA: DNA helicase RecQ [Gemmataceae bacterium]|nr:DNA helicase RecQ [Gemmataceae bacterium]